MQFQHSVIIIIFKVNSKVVFNCSCFPLLFTKPCSVSRLPFQDDGRLASSMERAETGQGDQQALNTSWSSPQHSLRSQSLRSSPVAYKKPQPSGELQRRSSTSLGERVEFEMGTAYVLLFCVVAFTFI